MSKYSFSDSEKETLKVAKHIQNKSKNLESRMDSLGKSMEATIDKTEKILSEMKQKHGIADSADSSSLNALAGKDNDQFLSEMARKYGAAGTEPSNVSDETTADEENYAEPKDWNALVNEANSEIKGDVGFENLLTQKEFAEAYAHLNQINEEFSKKTGLRKRDYAFLTVAIALQCFRQYVYPLLKNKRLAAGPLDEAGRKANKEAGWYYVDKERILTSKVPFDVHRYSGNSSVQGFLKGGDHRLMTLGHDPVLGWIFGTANIMTGTVTRKDFISAHVKCIDNENTIYSLADTCRIFFEVFNRITGGGWDGKIALGCAIAREAIHLKSDVMTKRGLPLPGIGVVSSEFGKKLVKYGIDTAGVGTQWGLAHIINVIIGMVHRLGFDEAVDGDPDLYEVRTRKIILYSNLIASTSNVIAVYFTHKVDLLDVGGLIETLSKLITDVRFMCKVRDEYVKSKLDAHFQGIREETERLYKEILS